MKIYTIDELAALLQVNRATISRAVGRGEFPTPQRVGRGLRWPESAINAWFEQPANVDDHAQQRRGRPRRA
jgi:excisionase family DNA binding protein